MITQLSQGSTMIQRRLDGAGLLLMKNHLPGGINTLLKILMTTLGGFRRYAKCLISKLEIF